MPRNRGQCYNKEHLNTTAIETFTACWTYLAAFKTRWYIASDRYHVQGRSYKRHRRKTKYWHLRSSNSKTITSGDELFDNLYVESCYVVPCYVKYCGYIWVVILCAIDILKLWPIGNVVVIFKLILWINIWSMSKTFADVVNRGPRLLSSFGVFRPYWVNSERQLLD